MEMKLNALPWLLHFAVAAPASFLAVVTAMVAVAVIVAGWRCSWLFACVARLVNADGFRALFSCAELSAR